jgi:hypothetical protein
MFRSFAEEANALRKGGFNVEENALVVNIASHREPDGRLGIGLFWGHGHWASRLPAREYASIFLGPGFSLCNENDANAYVSYLYPCCSNCHLVDTRRSSLLPIRNSPKSSQALIRAIESHPASYVGLEIRTDSVIAFRCKLGPAHLGTLTHPFWIV